MLATFASMVLLAGVAPADQEVCTRTNSVGVTWQQIKKRPSQFTDRCVAVEGYYFRGELFEDSTGHYRFWQSRFDSNENDGWLGLYPAEEIEFSWNDSPRMALVHGVLKDCTQVWKEILEDAKKTRRELRSRGEDEIIVFAGVGGYCHSIRGFAIFGASLDFGDQVEWKRCYGNKARKKFGDLQRAFGLFRPPAKEMALIRKLERAIEQGDRKWIDKTSLGREVKRRSAAEDALSADMLEKFLNHDFVDFSKGRRQFFKARHGEYPDHPGSWFSCYCKTADCEGKWPISSVDADAEPDRPYLCVELKPSFDDPNRLHLWLRPRIGLPE